MKINETGKKIKINIEFSQEEYYYICICLRKLMVYHGKDINGFTKEFFDSLIKLEGGEK